MLKVNKKFTCLYSVALGIITSFSFITSAKAAEKLFFTYGALNFSLRVASLELFAEQGKINEDLKFYLNQANPEEQAKFRELLQRRFDVDPVLLSRFLNTSIGEAILKNIGNSINIQGGINGKFAIRGALIQAATSPEGLTLLNIFRKFPTNIQFDLENMQRVGVEIDELTNLTKLVDQQMEELSAQEAKQEVPVDFSTVEDLRKPGAFPVEKTTLNLEDQQRQRKLYVEVYYPKIDQQEKIPVIIFSHGLGSRPEDFAKYGQHLASYGYLVALPQHPGSDYQKIQDLIAGYTRQVYDLNEFIDRPLDISFVLDELEKLNQTDFAGKLILQQVGVTGHSFGGYTAIAVAGAEIDFDYLQKQCARPVLGLNLSLVLQCQALALPKKNYNFRDERVTAVMALNPFNSLIFGPKGLSKVNIPIILLGGSHDIATPIAYEQGGSFAYFGSSNKYLALAEAQAHVDTSVLDAQTVEVINSLPNMIIAEQDVIDNYINALQLSFFQVYLLKNVTYIPYLQSQYAQYLSKDAQFKLYMIDASSAKPLESAIDKLEEKYQ